MSTATFTADASDVAVDTRHVGHASESRTERVEFDFGYRHDPYSTSSHSRTSRVVPGDVWASIDSATAFRLVVAARFDIGMVKALSALPRTFRDLPDSEDDDL